MAAIDPIILSKSLGITQPLEKIGHILLWVNIHPDVCAVARNFEAKLFIVLLEYSSIYTATAGSN